MLRKLDIKWCAFGMLTIFLAVLLVLLGPADYFTHGDLLNIDLPEIAWIPQDEFGTDIMLDEGESFTVEFISGQPHLSGFYIYLGEQQAERGTIEFSVTDLEGKILETDRLNIEEMKLPSWQKISTDHNFSGGGVLISNF